MASNGDDSAYEAIRALFIAAQERDEFEFACCLLRVRGMEAPGWDPYAETHDLIGELLGLMNAPLRGKTKTRLALLLYSHLTELDAVYELLANLIRVVKGDRYSMDPFANPPNARNNQSHPPSAAMVHGWLCDDLREEGWTEVADALESFFDKEIRNAFAHADYVITPQSFRSPSAQFLVNGIITPELPLERLAERLNAAFRVIGAVVDLHIDLRTSYTEAVDTRGRLRGDGEAIPVRLLADPEHGLYGFTTDINGEDETQKTERPSSPAS
ncbi:MAG: hypothetical protein ACRDMH_05035 [Solirubrobacterales bacterium]